MIFKILIFFAFLSPLIFFHELGHFLMARIFGVHVEVFSIGFGPKLLKFKRGATQYALSLIPLGGYVKMFGDDPYGSPNLTDEEKQKSFNHKSKWARFCIVFGGPLANFMLAYVLFFSLLIVGEDVPEIKVGPLLEKSFLYDLGMRSGDKLVEINGTKVIGPTDFSNYIGKAIKEVRLERGGDLITLTPNVSGKELLERVSNSIGLLRNPLVINSKGELFELALTAQKSFTLEELAHLSLNKNIQIYKYDLEKRERDSAIAPQTLFIKGTSESEFFTILRTSGFYPLDIQVKSVSMSSPADKEKIEAGDIILSLNGTPLHSFETLRLTIQGVTEPVTLEILRKGERFVKKMMPETITRDKQNVKILGVYSSADFEELQLVKNRSQGLFPAIVGAFHRCLSSITGTIDSFKKLITNEVSFKNIGGPLAIGKVASDSFGLSLTYFFQIMALISVNLGIINLFPIPVLDGGHIMFLALEAINRGPISRRKMEIAQQVGISFLLFLTFAALFNDVTRFF